MQTISRKQPPKLVSYTKPASLQKFLGKQLASNDRDKKRVEVIKKVVNGELH